MTIESKVTRKVNLQLLYLFIVASLSLALQHQIFQESGILCRSSIQMMHQPSGEGCLCLLGPYYLLFRDLHGSLFGHEIHEGAWPTALKDRYMGWNGKSWPSDQTCQPDWTQFGTAGSEVGNSTVVISRWGLGGLYTHTFQPDNRTQSRPNLTSILWQNPKKTQPNNPGSIGWQFQFPTQVINRWQSAYMISLPTWPRDDQLCLLYLYFYVVTLNPYKCTLW